MTHGVLEGWCGDPAVVVVQKVDRIPFPSDEDVENVHYVGAIRDDYLSLDYGIWIMESVE